MWSIGTKNKGNVFLLIVNMAMTYMLFVIITQQITLVNSTWSTKLIQHEQAIKDYDLHRCGRMNTTNIQFINECERLSIVMSISPLMASVTAVINGWHSCIAMPCTQLVYTITNHYEYRILFLLVSFGCLYYGYKLMSTTHDRSIVLQDMIRADITRKYKEKDTDWYREYRLRMEK